MIPCLIHRKGRLDSQTVTPQRAPKTASAAKPQQDLGRAIRDTAKDAVKEAAFHNRPYLKLAFANPYNLSLLLGGVTASVLTANPLPAVVAIGAEALWLLHGSDSKYLRRILWDPRLEKIRFAMEAQDRAVKMKDLPDSEQQRVAGSSIASSRSTNSPPRIRRSPATCCAPSW